jgi:hypothetical protein
MIKTNELRIGNKVLNDKGFEMEVMAIFKNEVYLDFEGNQGDWWEEKEEDIYPIFINEKWKYKILKNKYIFTKSKEYFEIYKDHVSCALSWVDFPSIHQIQNLYFELTKQELKIE